MRKINLANLKKTIYYLRRNGLKNTWYAARERLEEQKMPPYFFMPLEAQEAERQCRASEAFAVTFSIVVPTYHTKEEYLRDMIDSVVNQTYPKWELLLADASQDESVETVVKTYQDARIKYIHLDENAGISENTNQALPYVTGDYTGLLDHDDVLTQDALYEMAGAIEAGKKRGIELKLLYSDEDKCNGDRTEYYETHRKENFNLDLLLCNNYICHFMVLKSTLIKELGFRREYDGAQDYDLALRAVGRLLDEENQIAHIPKVLYHWRCHVESTAQNPQSKQYAYEAGKRAVQDFADRHGIAAGAVHMKHLGFYRLEYQEPILRARADLGAVGGRLLKQGRIISGRLSEDGSVFYEGLPAYYSGYMHRAVLQQDAEAVDIRLIEVREECRGLFEQIAGVPYTTLPGQEVFDASTLPEGTDYRAASIALCRSIRAAGYRILWEPELSSCLKGNP
ncbi:MAG: glycosyltransferase [Acetatifactor sp.]